jgi:hypothetical protein
VDFGLRILDLFTTPQTIPAFSGQSLSTTSDDRQESKEHGVKRDTLKFLSFDSQEIYDFNYFLAPRLNPLSLGTIVHLTGQADFTDFTDWIS